MKEDKRNCPKCKTRMRIKWQWDDGLQLWQCPKCKEVEFLYGEK